MPWSPVITLELQARSCACFMVACRSLTCRSSGVRNELSSIPCPWDPDKPGRCDASLPLVLCSRRAAQAVALPAFPRWAVARPVAVRSDPCKPRCSAALLISARAGKAVPASPAAAEILLKIWQHDNALGSNFPFKIVNIKKRDLLRTVITISASAADKSPTPPSVLQGVAKRG